MKKAITAAIAASVLMIGCTNQSTEVRKLQAENDSLLRVNAQTTADFNEMIQLMNEVEDGFRQIKEAENYLVTQKDANEPSPMSWSCSTAFLHLSGLLSSSDT